MRSVFILGAGASKEADAPLMFEFLDEAEKLLRSNKTGPDEEKFKLVFRGIAELQLVYAKADLDTRNLESVFSAFEMAGLTGRLGNIRAEASELAPALRSVIARTLESSITFERPRGTTDFLAPYTHKQFAEKLKTLGPGRASVLTFNYDLALDYALWKEGQPISYGLDPGTRGPTELGLFKLHGSLNWHACTCLKGGVASWGESLFEPTPPVWTQIGTGPNGSGIVRMNTLDHLPNCAHCGVPVQEPFIVAPALSKGERQKAIAGVWRHAAETLSDAEYIFVIGYSLPTNDEFFRYLFALGTIGTARPKLVRVFDPSLAAWERFHNFLGRTMKERLVPFQVLTFGNAIQNIPWEELRD
jgi:hypothetical protein